MFRNLIIRDLKIAFFTSTNFLFPASFFLLILILIPFIFGSEIGLLKIMFKGLIWIALVLSILLTLSRIFNSDYDDGNLDIIISVKLESKLSYSEIIILPEAIKLLAIFEILG